MRDPDTERQQLAVPLRDNQQITGAAVLVGRPGQRLSSQDAVTAEMLGVLATIAICFTELHKPLLPLTAVAARLQANPYHLDTALRIILTGITAAEGLGFTRAMVFLADGENGRMRGRVAVGPLYGHEARTVWQSFVRTEPNDPEVTASDRLDALLQESQQFSRKVQEGAPDSNLSTHIQATSISIGNSQLVNESGVLSWRAFPELEGKGNWPSVCAYVRLTYRDQLVGYILADRAFQTVVISPTDVRLLRLFGNVAGSTVHNLSVKRIASERDMLDQWRHLFSEARHELGTRMTFLDGFVQFRGREIISNSGQEDDWKEFLRIVRQLIAHASYMSQKVQPWKRELLTICEKIELVEFAHAIIGHAQFTLQAVDVPPPRCLLDADCKLYLLCDPLELEGAFFELLKNAFEAIERHGTGDGFIKVQISLRHKEDGEDTSWAVIHVADNGPGIPKQQRERVFEPQYTTKKTGAASTIHGYGLVGAKRRIEALGGTITVVDSKEPGACFEIRLPVAVESSMKAGTAG